MSALENIDSLLKKLKSKEADVKIFNQFKAELLNLQVDIERGKPINFNRVAHSRKGELQLSSKCFFLRTLPLDEKQCFIALHRETGFYRKGRKSRYSADILGIWRSRDTTKLAVAELKQGVGGDSLVYAVAEGLRNLCLAISHKKKLSDEWVKEPPVDAEVYAGKYNPFTELGKRKKAQLLILGDESWIKARILGSSNRINREMIQANKIIHIDGVEIGVTVYSFSRHGKPASKPHALLPLAKIL